MKMHKYDPILLRAARVLLCSYYDVSGWLLCEELECLKMHKHCAIVLRVARVLLCSC